MRGYARAAAKTGVLALVLTSCGLAALSSPALAPESAARPRGDALAVLERYQTTDRGAAPIGETTLLQKVVLAPEPAAVAKPTLAAASVAPMKHIGQSLNNCGPASVVMILSTLGIDADQETARLALRGPDWRRGMGPGPVDRWVKELYGLRAAWRNNGTDALMKALVSNGFAPMVTQWLEDPWVSRISHWRTVQGYDDARGVFQVYDPLRGRIALTYEWFDRNWQPFSYRYLVIHKPEDEALLRTILASDWSERAVRATYFERARREAMDRNDSASWLAYGEAAYQFGMFAEAVEAIEKGLSLGSGTGVFMLRSSLPNALRALGHHAEADAAQARLSNITPGVLPASAPISTTFTLDPTIAAIVAEREREERAYAAIERRLLLKLARDR